jgi:hypothetical protein
LDHWHPDGVLLETYGSWIIYEVGSHLYAELSTVIRDKEWYWQAARSDNLVRIQSKRSLVYIEDEDKPIWSISKKEVLNCDEQFISNSPLLHGVSLFGFLRQFLSKLLFYGWLFVIICPQVIGCSDGVMLVMFSVFFAGKVSKEETICFFIVFLS